MKRTYASCITALGVALSLTAATSAATLEFDNRVVETGTGIGAVAQLLVLQQQGNATTEQGGVTFSGATSADVLTGDAKPQSQTLSVAELESLGITRDNFGVVLNINEEGGGDLLTVNDFSLVFQNANGVELFTAPFTGTLNLDTVASAGTGTSGYLFDVVGNGPITNFFNNPTNRLGLRVDSAFTDADAGMEVFYIASVNDSGPVPIPEPTTAGLVLLGMAGVLTMRRGRRK